MISTHQQILFGWTNRELYWRGM